MHMQEYNKFNTFNACVQEGKMHVCLNTSFSICIMSYCISGAICVVNSF